MNDLPLARLPRRVFRGTTSGVFCLLAACQGVPFLEGGRHQAGDRMFVGRFFHGEPIVGRTLVWIAWGDVPNDGASLQNYWYPADRLAVGVGVDRVAFRPPGGSVIGWEFESRLRYHGLEGKIGLFADFNCGWMVTEHPIPPEGTRSNYTFSFGPGVEIPLKAGFSFLMGLEMHHWSNARGRYASDNPAQNEFFPWVGFGIPW